MNWTAKSRGGAAASPAVAQKPSQPTTGTVAQPAVGRTSNSLKEFLWMLSDIKRGRILDLCPASQTTLNFFIEKGFRISAEDMLRTWKQFLNAEEERMRGTAAGEAEILSPAELGAKFLETNLNYAPESFHGIL